MRAVNLIPKDARRGRGDGNGAAGVYLLLGALAALVVMVGAFTILSGQVDDRERVLAAVEAEATAAEQRVTALGPYTKFAAMSRQRVETVNQLVAGRFDWAQALREVARIVPQEADLLTLSASTPSGDGGASGSSPRAALGVPAFDITGCTSSQVRVATLLARLRAVDGVKRVSLASSEKADSGAASDTDCRSDDRRPKFTMTVFFNGRPAPAPQAAPATASTGGAP